MNSSHFCQSNVIPFYQNFNLQNPISHFQQPSQCGLLNIKALQLAQFQQLYLQNMKQFYHTQNKLQVQVQQHSSGLASPFSANLSDSKSDFIERDFVKSEAVLFKEEACKLESSVSDSFSNSSTQLEKFESESSQCSSGVIQDIDDSSLRAQLSQMVKFLLHNMGKNNQALIESTRNLYLNNKPLLQVYDYIVKKYFSSRKVKEEIIRYILRKAFKVLKQNLQKTENVKGKKASVLFVKKYLPSQIEYLDQLGVSTDNEEDLVNLLMPYNSKSKNKTMNMKFVSEIFSSEAFLQDYTTFLNSLGSILEEENNKKIDSLVTALEGCVQSGNFSKVNGIRMFPWLNVWINDTKNIAVALLPNRRLIYNYKKPKF